jgi:hypothetical protein
MKTQTRISYIQLIQPDDFHSSLLLEETLHKENENKLSWADTYKQIGQSFENWDDFDVTLLDGL